MNQKIFQIKWKQGCFYYFPLAAKIQLQSAGFSTDKNNGLASEALARFRSGSDSQQEITITKSVPLPLVFRQQNSPRLMAEAFHPICLTLYLNHQCNLACAYCYRPANENSTLNNINLAAVEAAAEFVAHNCVRRKSPFILGFHGDNEPLLHLGLLKKCLEICRRIAQKYDLPLLTFCTTNGVISPGTAEWAVQHFYGITLSWDGLDEIHDRFRPQKEGRPTAEFVRRTASIFLRRDARLRQFKVRATVTHSSVNQLLEIVQFFHRHQVRWVEMYPVYQNTSQSLDQSLLPGKVEFVQNFLKARQWAQTHGMRLGYAGSRLADFHHRHCPLFQNNLTLTPDGFLTACFQITHNQRPQNEPFIYGSFDHHQQQLKINRVQLTHIFAQLTQTATPCQTCFNYWHCARGCPNGCPLQSIESFSNEADCTVERWIGLANLLEATGYKLTENDLADCQKFFYNISVQDVTPEKIDAPV